MDDTVLIALLLDAYYTGIKVHPGEGRMRVTSPYKGHPLISKLRDCKPGIEAFYAQLGTRLRKGQQLLISQNQSLWDKDGWPVGSDTPVGIFGERLALWDILDTLMVPRVCPIGPDGCDPEAPIICRSCGR